MSDAAFAAAARQTPGVWLVPGFSKQNINSRRLNGARVAIAIPTLGLWASIGTTPGAIYLVASLTFIGVPVSVAEDRRIRLAASVLEDQLTGIDASPPAMAPPEEIQARRQMRMLRTTEHSLVVLTAIFGVVAIALALAASSSRDSIRFFGAAAATGLMASSTHLVRKRHTQPPAASDQ
ncbi:MAG TPA: hypothetical protein VHA79_11195 [Mycobacteriales bacterium]|nr:hypothetical protein [Mycobacteriales bacterium]